MEKTRWSGMDQEAVVSLMLAQRDRMAQIAWRDLLRLARHGGGTAVGERLLPNVGQARNHGDPASGGDASDRHGRGWWRQPSGIRIPQDLRLPGTGPRAGSAKQNVLDSV